MATTTEQKETTSVEHIGDYVTDVELSIWMRPRKLTVVVHGLRPNTLFYPYFDGVDVSAHCQPSGYDTTKAVQVSNETGRPLISNTYMPPDADILFRSCYPVRGKGTELRSDDKGDLYFFFTIPEKTFKVGDRKLEVFDAFPYTSFDAATSYAVKRYSAYSLKYSTEAAEVTTRTIETITTVENETEAPLPDDNRGEERSNKDKDNSYTKLYEDADGNKTIVKYDSYSSYRDGAAGSATTQITTNDAGERVTSTVKPGTRESTASTAKDTHTGNTGKCFLTTAIVEMRGEADDCETLTKLRGFRDTYMSSMPEEVYHYYEVAPKIVSSIPKNHKDWDWIGVQIDDAVSMIDIDNLEEAYSIYKNMVVKLERDWINK